MNRARAGSGDRAKRPLLWIVVVAVFGLVVGYIFRPQGQMNENVRRSFHRTTPDGVAALARAIERLGRTAAPRITPLVDADPIPGTLMLLEPPLFPSPREVRALLDRVREGGTLLYIPRYRATDFETWESPLMDSLGVRFRFRTVRNQILDQYLEEPAWNEHALTAGLSTPDSVVHGLGIEGGDEPDSTRLRDVELLLTATGPEESEWEGFIAARIALGEGRVLIFSEGGPLSNARTEDHPLAVVAVRAALAYTSETDTVFFDEFHQGIRSEKTRAEVLRDFFLGSPGGRTLLHVVAVSFLILASLGLRFGAPTPAVAPPDLERRSPLEHVSALGDLYRKAEAGNTAALLLLARLARSARRAPPSNTDEADAMLARLDAGAGSNTALTQVRKALGTSPPDLAAIAAGVDEYIARRTGS